MALAVQLRALGAEAQVCAPPDEEFAELLAGVGVPMVPFDRPWRSWERPSTPEQRTRRVAEFIEAQYDAVAVAAHGCDLLIATAMSHFVARSVAENVGIPHRYVIFAPNVLDDPDAQSWNELFGPSINAHRVTIGLAPVADIRAFMFTDSPLLAADPTLGPWHGPADSDVVQTGAWSLPDERPLPAELVAFLDAGEPPVYIGFGSMRGLPDGIAKVAIEAIRARGRRVLVGHGWADRPGDRRGTRRSRSHRRLTLDRTHRGPHTRDPRTSDRRGPLDRRRRGDRGRAAAARSEPMT